MILIVKLKTNEYLFLIVSFLFFLFNNTTYRYCDRLINMSLETNKFDKRLVKEIIIILVIKITLLMLIKNIWFDSPTIPKNFDNQVAERIAGSSSQIKETR